LISIYLVGAVKWVHWSAFLLHSVRLLNETVSWSDIWKGFRVHLLSTSHQLRTLYLVTRYCPTNTRLLRSSQEFLTCKSLKLRFMIYRAILSLKTPNYCL
jgi:hypothetical protein